MGGRRQPHSRRGAQLAKAPGLEGSGMCGSQEGERTKEDGGEQKAGPEAGDLQKLL